jgi:hypothetical protein
MRFGCYGILLVWLSLPLGACSTSSEQECVPDSYFCEQDTLRKCTTDGTDSVLVSVCENTCSAGKCVTLLTGDVADYDVPAGDAIGGEDQKDPADVMSLPDSADATEPAVDADDVGPPPEEVTEDVGGCLDECELDEFYCVGIKEIHYCMEGGDGCLVWDEGESCDDGNDCTDDACAAEKGCVKADNKEDCDDDNPCTGPDKCGEGECQSGPAICQCEADQDCADLDDGNLCNGILICVANECTLDDDSVVECAGKVGPCLENVCNEDTGSCADEWMPEGQDCDDDDLCTTGDSCFEGSCAGSGSFTCDDDNLCTVDSCLPQSGCIYEPEPDGKACDANAQCANGKCIPTAGPETLADKLDSPHDLAIDDSFVYFVEDDSDEGTVKKVAKTGGNVTTLASNLAEPLAIAVDSTHVYWLERNNGSNGRLAKVSKNGGNVTDLSTDLHNAQNHLAIAGNFLYFGDGKGGGGGVIKKVGINGGTTIIVEGNGLLNLNTAIAVDNGLVYFKNDYDKVLRVSVSGGDVTELGSGEPSGLAIGDSWIYWTEYSNGNVMRMPKNGGPGINLAKNSYGAGDLVLDGNYLYWIENNNPGKVRRVSTTGGDEKTYSNQANSLGIEVDGQYVYYAVSVYINKGKIIRTPK